MADEKPGFPVIGLLIIGGFGVAMLLIVYMVAAFAFRLIV
jgi:hypothetical protein